MSLVPPLNLPLKVLTWTTCRTHDDDKLYKRKISKPVLTAVLGAAVRQPQPLSVQGTSQKRPARPQHRRGLRPASDANSPAPADTIQQATQQPAKGKGKGRVLAMDGRIVRCGIISSCQSAATSEIVKRF